MIKSNDSVKRSILKRIADLGLTNSAIIKDAATLGREIGAAQLSRYLSSASGQTPNSLTQETIVWICTRYCIPITVAIGNQLMVEAKDGTNAFKLKMPPYDEAQGRKNIRERFGVVENNG